MVVIEEHHTVLRPRLHPGQRLVEAESRRENWLDAGRRWRKTSLLVGRGVEEISSTGHTWIWGAPVYKQVRVAWDEMEKCTQGNWNLHRGEMWAECPWNGGRFFFFSLDNPDIARAYTANTVVIDEAADVHPDAYHKVLRPMLLDTMGTFWGVGTPKGHNWFWREFVAAEERLRQDPSADCATWRVPTLGARIEDHKLIREPHPYENPNISFAELQRIFEDPSTPELAFRQEYLAEFVDDGVGVFRGVDGAAYGVALVPPYVGPYCSPYRGTFAMGIDWGRYNDFTVLTLMDCATKKVVDWDRFNLVSWDEAADRAAAMWLRWKAVQASVSVLAESNSIGDVGIEKLQQRGIPVTPWTATNLTKAAIIERLQFAVEHAEVSYPRIPVLLAELKAFAVERLPSGLIRYGAPEDGHDDTVISLALAYEGTSYRDPADEQTSFTVDAQWKGSNEPSEGDKLIEEYRASFWAKKARDDGADFIPIGARDLVAAYTPDPDEDDA